MGERLICIQEVPPYQFNCNPMPDPDLPLELQMEENWKKRWKILEDTVSNLN